MNRFSFVAEVGGERMGEGMVDMRCMESYTLAGLGKMKGKGSQKQLNIDGPLSRGYRWIIHK